MSWDCTRSIDELPNSVSHEFQRGAGYFYHDLAENRLRVTLIEAPDPRFAGHMLRQVESRNPRWYSDLYHSIAHLKRTRSLCSLGRIMLKKDLPYCEHRGAIRPFGSYDTLYRQLILQYLTVGINEGTKFESPLERPLERATDYSIGKKLPWPEDREDEVLF